MTSTNESQILRTDGRGRVLVSKERREGLVDEFERSGLSGAKFAEFAGIKYSTFANWVQQRRKQRHGAADGKGGVVIASVPMRLVEAAVDVAGAVDAFSKAGGGSLVVELPGSGRIRVETPSQIRLAAQLLVCLEQTRSLPC